MKLSLWHHLVLVFLVHLYSIVALRCVGRLLVFNLVFRWDNYWFNSGYITAIFIFSLMLLLSWNNLLNWRQRLFVVGRANAILSLFSASIIGSKRWWILSQLLLILIVQGHRWFINWICLWNRHGIGVDWEVIWSLRIVVAYTLFIH